MGNIENSKEKVFSFMEAVQDEIANLRSEEEFLNTPHYKLKLVDREKDKARCFSLDKIFSTIYKDAIPLNDEYKDSNCEDIDTAFRDFMQTKCPNGIEWYVKEGLKKNSPFARRVLEAVTDLVDKEYYDREMNIDDVDPDELAFDSEDDQFTKKLCIIDKDLELPEISLAIQNNVRDTALSEIRRAKEEKEKLKSMEAELANDIKMNNTAAVEAALEDAGMGNTDYVPSLFNAIFINKVNKLTPKFEAGELDLNIGNALEEYGRTGEAGLSDLAFIEAVKEYTGLSMLKALRLESFDKYVLNDLIQEYAEERF